MSGLEGFPRAGGAVGARNELLVLPSVVCATHAARRIAGEGDGIAVVHQHGCLHVGDDLVHTERELRGVALNPNVGAVVVVSLGCETLRGAALAREIETAGQRVELVGIQAIGGTEAAVEAGVAATAALRDELALTERRPGPDGWLTVGLDWPDDAMRGDVIETLIGAGIGVVEPPDGMRGAEAHTELAVSGAQLIVSRPGDDEAPMGFAVVPVLAVAADSSLHRALADDFDLAAPSGDQGLAPLILDGVREHAAGKPTSAERRGARDFVLRRLAMTM
jgi:altronate dehydratase